MRRKALIVGGTWDNEDGFPSGLIVKLSDLVSQRMNSVTTYNGGNYNELPEILESAKDFNVVFWFANVFDNSLPKIRDVKSVAPHTLLVTSKRNDFNVNGTRKYDFEELVQRALSQKANLCFEFTKIGTCFNTRVFDPLGCLWYDGLNIKEAVDAAMTRLEYLESVTRNGSVNAGEKITFIPNENDEKFLAFVKQSADTFHKLMMLPEHVDRFVGNASMRFTKETRCMNGFPYIKKGNTVFISRRNVDKTGITFDDFVPCRLWLDGIWFDDDQKVVYQGENKPSVDAPVQLRLFRALPHIDYMLHGHCYITDAPMTSMAIPCGAVEEADEILSCVDKNADFITLNLKGHGCLIMAGANRLDDMFNVKFEVRPIPEIM